MGFDGLDVGKYYHPSLTTVKQPGFDMVCKSIELLVNEIAGEENHQKVFLPAELLERDSVKKIK